jgi:drug/metabolite transporter (DMT)-like permease
MKIFRKIVDERQELEMMRVERASFWVIFFALVIVISVQTLALGFDLKHIAGESVALALGAVWAVAGHIRKGSYDYFTKPGMKSYVGYSLAGGLIFGLAAPLANYFRYDTPIGYCLLFFVINFVCIFVLCFLALLLLGNITKKRQKKLQQEYVGEEE